MIAVGFRSTKDKSDMTNLKICLQINIKMLHVFFVIENKLQ